MMHPATALASIDPEIGFGVIATEPIPRGTIVWTLDPLDQVISPRDRAAMPASLRGRLDHFSYRDDLGCSVLCWDHARYVNHSCESNCLGPSPLHFEVAVRDIAVGEQLTDDYRYFDLDAGFPCRCGEASCEGVVRVDEKARTAAFRAQRLDLALGDVWSVAQPLMSAVVDREFFDSIRLVS